MAIETQILYCILYSTEVFEGTVMSTNLGLRWRCYHAIMIPHRRGKLGLVCGLNLPQYYSSRMRPKKDLVKIYSIRTQYVDAEMSNWLS